MNVIKVKFNIDIDNEQQLKSFNAFVSDLKKANGDSPIVEAPVKDINSKTETTPTATQPAATQPAATQPAATQPAATPTGSKKLDAIRALIGKKAGEHREKMKAKLLEFGANTATDLVVEKYDEFHKFLEEL